MSVDAIGILELRKALSAIRHTRATTRLDDSPLLALALVDARLGAEGLSDSVDSRRWVLGLLFFETASARLSELRGGGELGAGDDDPELEHGQLAGDFAAGQREREAWSTLFARYLSKRELAMSEVAEIAGVGRTTLARRLNEGLEALADRLRSLELEALKAVERVEDGLDLGQERGDAEGGERASLADAGARASVPPAASRIPIRRSHFVGRQSELETIRGLVDSAPLVTLTGAGGSGKTRLALQIASDMAEALGEDLWWVDLAPLTDSGSVVEAAAAAVGVLPAVGQTLETALAEHLAPRTALLVLDNCEHVVDAAAALANRLLTDCDQLGILATSQEALGVEGERNYAVPPLGLPDPAGGEVPEDLAALQQSDAVGLFLDRAQAVEAGYQLTEANALAIAGICRRLDGLPLAIELAAARVRLMAPAEIERRLDERLRLLTAGKRTAVPRQRTLRASLDWSYALLNESEHRLLQRLSVFAGGWGFDSAEAICGGDGLDEWAVIDTLGGLVDKSFVVVEDSETGTRYRLLETVRQYARERLDEAGDEARMLAAHAQHFCRLAEAVEPELTGPRQAELLGRLVAEHDNLLAAIERCLRIGGQAAEETALRLVGAAGSFWSKHNALIVPGRSMVARVLEATDARAEQLRPERAKAFLVGGNLWRQSGHPAASLELYEQAYALALEEEDDASVARALTGLGKASSSLTRYAEAKRHLRQSLGLYRELGDKLGTASSLNSLAVIAEQQGDVEDAIAMHEQAVELARGLGDALSTAISLANLARAFRARGDGEAAHALFTESREISQGIGDRIGVAWTAQQLGGMAIEQGRYDEAEQLIREGLGIFREMGNAQRVAWSFEQLAHLDFVRGRLEEAAERAAETLARFEATGIQRGIASAHRLLGVIARARGKGTVALEHAEAALAIFREVGERPNIATARFNLGNLALDAGDLETARREHRTSLELRRRQADRDAAISLLALGHVERRAGQPRAARPLFAEALAIYRRLDDLAGSLHAVESIALVDASARPARRAAELLASVELQLRATPLVGEEGLVEADVERAFVALGELLPRAEVGAIRDGLRAELGDVAYERAREAGAALSLAAAVDVASRAAGPGPDSEAEDAGLTEG